MALATLALAVILTAVACELELELASWSGCLSLTSLGLWAVMAGNPLTLLLAWSALDITDLYILLRLLGRADERKQAIYVFVTRVSGIFLILFGFIFSSTKGILLQFDQVPIDLNIYLLLATSLRLGVIPLHMTFWQEPPLRRGIGTVSRMTTVATSLVFLPRLAAAGVLESQSVLLNIVIGVIALYAGFSWISAVNELEGRAFWILGMAALSLAAAIRGQPLPTLVWGVMLVFSGGLLFLYSARNRVLLLLPLLGVLGAVALPFTPTWYAGQFFGPPFSLWQVVYLISYALLLGGMLRHSLQPREDLVQMERWVWVIYPLGLLLMVVSHYLAGWLGGTLLGDANWPINLGTVLPGLILLGLVMLVQFLVLRGFLMPQRWQATFGRVFSLIWFYNILGWFFTLIEKAFAFITTVLEGDGGILWALLLLTLLMAFLSQLGLAGG